MSNDGNDFLQLAKSRGRFVSLIQILAAAIMLITTGTLTAMITSDPIATMCCFITLNTLFVLLVLTIGGTPCVEGLGLSTQGRIGSLLVKGVCLLPIVWIVEIAILLCLLGMVEICGGSEALESIREITERTQVAISVVPLLLALPLSAMIGFYEEVLFRGILLSRLVSITRCTPAAVIINSIIFGACHLYQGWIGAVVIGVVGLMFTLMTVHYRSIWPAIACHAAFDAVVFAQVYINFLS
jgi:membrane protease YdiL (CAAX protease family)